MSSLLKNIIRFIGFLLVQVYVLNKVPPVHQFVVPYLYFLYILWLPFGISRWWLLIIAFAFGMSLDYFLGTPGLHAAPCVLIAYLRPFLLNLFIAQESTEQSFAEPSLKSMGATPYFLYIFILTFIHNGYLTLIEWLQFGNIMYFLGKVLATTALSLILIFITEILFSRKGKYKTNVA